MSVAHATGAAGEPPAPRAVRTPVNSAGGLSTAAAQAPAPGPEFWTQCTACAAWVNVPVPNVPTPCTSCQEPVVRFKNFPAALLPAVAQGQLAPELHMCPITETLLAVHNALRHGRSPAAAWKQACRCSDATRRLPLRLQSFKASLTVFQTSKLPTSRPHTCCELDETP